MSAKKPPLDSEPDVSSIEYDRIRALINSGEIIPDPTLIVFSTDDVLQLSRADFIPFVHCSGERVEEFLRMMLDENGFDEVNL